MFLGHLAVGMAAKTRAPRASLGSHLMASQLVDLVWPIFLLLGIERVRIAPGITAASPLDFEWFPWTHSLLLSLAWSAFFGLTYLRVRRGDRRTALWLAAVVFSHWVLDWISHRPDLQIVPWSAFRVGLGLWNHPLATTITEYGLFLIGIVMYLRSTRARDKTGTIAFFAYCGVMAALYAMSSTGPPPPGVRVLAIVGLATWLFVPWGYWIDRHRTMRRDAAVSHV